MTAMALEEDIEAMTQFEADEEWAEGYEGVDRDM